MSLQKIAANRFVALLLLFCFANLLVQEYFAPAKVCAQTSGKELMQTGISHFRNAEFEQAITVLSQALSVGLTEKDDIIQTHKTLASCYAALGEPDKAKLELWKLLAKFPITDLLVAESPALQKLFQQAKEEYATGDKESPVIRFSLPQQALANTDLKIEAEVTDYSGLQSVKLYYKTVEQKTFRALEMQPMADNLYTITIPAQHVFTEGLDVYFEAIDKANNAPGLAGTLHDPLFIPIKAQDSYPPVISHKPVLQAKEGEPIVLLATVLDNIGIERVRAFYRQKGKQYYETKRMLLKGENDYELSLLGLPEGVEYYLEARDVSGNPPAMFRSAASPQFIRVIAKPKIAVVQQKGSNKLLYLGLGTVVVAGAVAGVILSGGNGQAVTPETDLPTPPSSPK